MSGRLELRAALYEGSVALLGWATLAYATQDARQPADLPTTLLFLLLAVALRRAGFRVARPVTHSLVGVAVLAAIIALGPVAGAWVAAVSGSLIFASRVLDADRPVGGARVRLALFVGGLNALMALVGAALYQALGGSWRLTTLRWQDLVPLAGLCLGWCLVDHVGWSGRIAMENGLARLGPFLRAIRRQSVLVELLPLPLASVVAITYAASGLPAFGLLALSLVAAGVVLRRLNLAVDRAQARVSSLTTLTAFSRALLAARLDVMELCRLLHAHTADVVDAHHAWLGLYDARQGRLEPALTTGGAAPPPGLPSGC